MIATRLINGLLAGLISTATATALPRRPDLADNCATSTPIINMTCYDFTKSDGTTVPIHVRTQDSNPEVYLPDISLRNTNYTLKSPPALKRNPFGYTDGVPQDQCDDSNFIQTTINPGAEKADCDAIRQWARLNDGDWVVSAANMKASDWYTLYTVKSCAFAVGQTNPNYQAYYGIIVGNVDVADLVEDSIKPWPAQNNADGTDMEANGNMPCISLVYDKNYPLNWILTKPGPLDSGNGV